MLRKDLGVYSVFRTPQIKDLFLISQDKISIALKSTSFIKGEPTTNFAWAGGVRIIVAIIQAHSGDLGHDWWRAWTTDDRQFAGNRRGWLSSKRRCHGGGGNEVAYIDLILGQRGSVAETAFCLFLHNTPPRETRQSLPILLAQTPVVLVTFRYVGAYQSRRSDPGVNQVLGSLGNNRV